MNANTVSNWLPALLLPALLGCLGGCASSPPPIVPDTYTLPAPAAPDAPILIGSGASASAAAGMVQVDAVDYTNRTCLLSRPGFEPIVFKVGPEYPNFDRVKVGDSFLTTVSKTFVAYLVKPGVSPSSLTNAVATTMPAGAQPGGVMIRNVDYNAKILVLDYATRRVVLQYGKDQAQEVFVPPGVNLQLLHVNDDVFVRTTEAIAIAVAPPGAAN
ncbi:MAG TPA: hypothetical protein VMB80_18300 [Candidatus Acidoferrum sp.]|nr:hypothetical protein [Candidatus Acidoferrum sp.]